MFDLRYHVASLAAVFVALLIGILVGVAMSGKVDDAEKQALESEVNRLDAQLEAASEGRANVTREQNAIRAFVKNAYPSLIADRLRGEASRNPLRRPCRRGNPAGHRAHARRRGREHARSGCALSRCRSTPRPSTAGSTASSGSTAPPGSTSSGARSRESSSTARTRLPGTP